MGDRKSTLSLKQTHTVHAYHSSQACDNKIGEFLFRDLAHGKKANITSYLTNKLHSKLFHNNHVPCSRKVSPCFTYSA